MVRLVQLNLTENKEGKKMFEMKAFFEGMTCYYFDELVTNQQVLKKNVYPIWTYGDQKKKKKKALNPSCGKVDK